MILSCSDAIAKAMERYLLEKKTPVGKKVAKMSAGYLEKVAGFCPDCGGGLEHESGCAVCRECGFSKCG
jgi:ribonucleoside-diphosphate reductase alpha chain